ncbi:MAG: D-alanyl-D-alanine carboxypeptidase/D-alanyl-D-alanine-endopeptidase [Pseudomonadota bacterium]
MAASDDNRTLRQAGPQAGRRAVLGGLAACVAGAAAASAPERTLRPAPRPTAEALEAARTLRASSAERIVADAQLGAGKVAFAVADAGTGEVLETFRPLFPQPPASVAKAVTALYALDRLGPGHRFATEVLCHGTMDDNGRLEGDLILAGSGDPLLQTNDLAVLATRLKEAGLTGVTGGFRVWNGALPRVERIDPGQPDHVGYNPAVSGLNLNFNRVHFEWRRAGAGYSVSMDARSDKYRPEVQVARMSVVSRSTPIYTYEDAGDVDAWTVASGALGSSGARWLPVREPALYAAEVFQTFARSHGIALGKPALIDALPDGLLPLTRVESASCDTILRGMLKYSTNITAEVMGLAATVSTGLPPRDLEASASRMSDWLAAAIGSRRPDFVDHSGLGGESRITPTDMVRALVKLGPKAGLSPLLKPIPLRDASYRVIQGSPVRVQAKTGTLNFVSGLGGYITAAGGRELAFAIFAADTERRSRIPKSQRERPDGAASWARRARVLQHRLIDRWVTLYG